MKALVVHPRFSIFGGGEYVCLNVIQSLQDSGYDVTLMSSDYDPKKVKAAFQYNGNLETVDRVSLTKFKPVLPRFLALQRTVFAKSERKKTKEVYRQYEVIWHTQTAYFLGPPENRTFNVFYDPSDIFLIQQISESVSKSIYGPLAKPYKRPYYAFLRRFSGNSGDISMALNIPLSSALEAHLERFGFRHCEYIFPPCDMSFKPRQKKRRIIQVTRVVPHKRLEDFVRIARCLPQYDFLIVGSISEMERSMHHKYISAFFESLPENMEYREGRIRDMPHLLEESAVYLYTSHEPGINISTAQAVGAGCIPITPNVGGGMEIVNHTGGYVYHNIEQAVSLVKSTLEDWDSEAPRELSEKAQIFSAEKFREKIRNLATGCH